MWGGTGQNRIDAGKNDGDKDSILVYTDSILNSKHGNPKGVNRDLIFNVEKSDAIFIHGADDTTLRYVEAIKDPLGSGLQGVGIYVEDSLEAFVVGNYTAEQVNAITLGGTFEWA